MQHTVKLIALSFIIYFSSIMMLNAKQLKVTGGNLKVNNASLVLQDMDLVNSGAITSTDGNIVFSSSSASNISGSGSTQFDSLTIDVAVDDFNLSKDVMIGSHLELQSGHLVLNDQDATLADMATVAGADANNYIQTNASGTLIRPVADADVTFPIGNSSYNPAILNNDGGTADFYSVRVRDELLENGSSGAQVDEYGVNRTWEIDEQSSGGSNIDVTLTWDTSDEIETTGSDYVQANYNSGEWNIVASGVASGTLGLNSLTSSDNSNLGDYAIFEDRSPLTDSYICNDNGALDITDVLNTTENYHAGTTLTSDALVTASASILYTAGTSIQL
ncbi:MAG: hypothetical protein AAGI23_23070 [Bacteroidota bacterium]